MNNCIQTNNIDVKFTITGGSHLVRNVIYQSVNKFKQVINHRSLRKFILNFTQLHRRGEKSFYQSKHSNAWLLKQFIGSGSIRIDFYIQGHNILAKTNKGAMRFSLSAKHFYCAVPAIVNNLVHEYCHLVGMHHSYFNPGWEKWLQTAPYAIGLKAEEIISKSMGVQSPVQPDAYTPSILVRLKRMLGL